MAAGTNPSDDLPVLSLHVLSSEYMGDEMATCPVCIPSVTPENRHKHTDLILTNIKNEQR